MKKSRKMLIAFVSMFVALFVLQLNVFAAKPIRNSSLGSPSNLITSNVTSYDLTLSWSSVSGATGYKVYMATPYNSNFTQIATVSTVTYKVSNLKPASYWFYMKAYNSSYTSADSAHINVTTNPAPVVTGSKTVVGLSVNSSSYNSMVANTSSLNEIATVTFVTDSAGNISGTVPTDQITYANSKNIKTLAMVANNFDGDITKAVLENQANRQNLINNILSQIKTNNYKGVNIDIEGIYYYDRSYFTTFMSELYSTLKPLGYSVTLDVPAKTSDSPTNSWNGAYDYVQLPNYADQIMIMAYDEHYPGGTPGAIASINWVQNVVNYAVSTIPKEKILLGTAAYGYDWSSNGTKAYSINASVNLATYNNAQILWDDIAKSHYFKYTDSTGISHTVYYEDSTSLSYKLDIVNNSNLSGIAMWRLGLENSDYWTTIKTKFNK